MDREIKFRIWDKFNKKMYFQNEISVGILPEDFYVIENLNGKIIVQPESVILMQYTGLKDKEGKEIYEGDIVKVSEHMNFNKFSGRKELVKFNLKTGRYDGIFYDLIPYITHLIIGNIFENPELLD